MRRPLRARWISLLSILIVVSCGRNGHDSKPFDTECLVREGDAALYYNLVVGFAETEALADDPPMRSYLDANGKPIPLADALMVNNPLRSPETGRDQVASTFMNYLGIQGFPTTAFAAAYDDIRNETGQDGPLDDPLVYFILAQRLEQDDELPESPTLEPYEEHGRLVSPDTALDVDNPSGDEETGSDNIVRVFGELYKANKLPARTLVDTYRQKYESCVSSNN